ncbi:MAG: hypothetical protein ABI682_15050 [Acidobacteriota bacterium]
MSDFRNLGKALLVSAALIIPAGCAEMRPEGEHRFKIAFDVAGDVRDEIRDLKKDAKDPSPDVTVIAVYRDTTTSPTTIRLSPKNVYVKAGVHAIVWYSPDGGKLIIDPDGLLRDVKCKKAVCSIKHFKAGDTSFPYSGSLDGITLDPRIEIVN